MSEPPSGIRIELVQFRPLKGRVDENLSRVAGLVREAAARADIIVFPECSLSGYFVEGAVGEVARSATEVAAGLGEASDDAPDVVIGFYERAEGPVHNAVAWLSAKDGSYRVVHRHRKMFLPTYGVFDEARFVAPGHALAAFDTRFGRAGMLVCEEMLHSVAPTVLALDGADLIVVVAASPSRDFTGTAGRPANLDMWDLTARAAAMEHGTHVAIAQLVGSEGGKVFPGGSSVHAPGGQELARGPLFEEARVPAILDRSRVARYRARSPLLSDLRVRLPHVLRSLEKADAGARPRGFEPEPPVPVRLPDPGDSSPFEVDMAVIERVLVSFLKDEVSFRRGFQDVVVGVSGGVDSAVTLALAARAFGPEHVHAFLLPYATSSSESLEHGRLACESVGVRPRVIEITPAVDSYIQAEEPDISALRRGNLAARQRAIVLWDQAARLNALPLGTGNKSERLLGYFTWHADDSPPVNPLGDLFKTQVWALARHLGVPDPIVEKAPSADLVQGVHDEDEIGVGYPVADRILHWLLEGYTAQDLIRAGFEEGAVTIVHGRLEGTHWKRELPTVAMLSTNSIGAFYLRPVDY